MYKFMNRCYFMKKTEINKRITSKKLILGESYMIQFNGCNGNIKNNGHTIDMSCQNFQKE